jgi:histidinol dehydrogenase
VILVYFKKIDWCRWSYRKSNRNLPRKAIAEKAIANSKINLCENDKIALDLIDEYGPEHFIVLR